MIFVYPYRKGSKSAKLLASYLKGKVLKLEKSKFKWNKPVVNWGNKNPRGNCLNPITNYARNKIKAFELLELAKVPIPPYTTFKHVAMEWVAKKKSVMARTNPEGQGGAGIVFLEDNPEVDAPLYTQYIKKTHEFRVHVVKDKVIHVQQKKLKNGHLPNRVRSHNNHYVFGRIEEAFEKDVRLLDAAREAVLALGLDFGAVDIIYNSKRDAYYVLEVNTAPGLSPQTAEKYANEFRSVFEVR